MEIKNYKFTGKEKYKAGSLSTNETGAYDTKLDAMEHFYENLSRINELQQSLYADRREGVIFVFQAMDAAGKDGAIRAVLSCLSPQGVVESSFKQPTKEELAHDYLWRFWKALPEKGCISIFNRSYYEDVLIAKVHKLYENQACAERCKGKDVIKQRYSQIKNFEKYLFENSIRVVKIFLNVSKEEQAKRFISRIDVPRKNWKISEGDILEREYWDDYQKAFEDVINTTSTKDSPWYVVPADHKWYARLVISQIVLNTLEEMNPQFPTISDGDLEKIESYRKDLVASLPKKLQKKYKKKIKENKNKVKFEAGVVGVPEEDITDGIKFGNVDDIDLSKEEAGNISVTDELETLDKSDKV